MELNQYTNEQRQGALEWLAQNQGNPDLIRQVTGELGLTPTDLQGLVQQAQNDQPTLGNYSGGDDGESTWTGQGPDPHNLWDQLLIDGVVVDPTNSQEVGQWLSIRGIRDPNEALQLARSIGAPVDNPQFNQEVIQAYQGNEQRIAAGGSSFGSQFKNFATDVGRFGLAAGGAYLGASTLGSLVGPATTAATPATATTAAIPAAATTAATVGGPTLGQVLSGVGTVTSGLNLINNLTGQRGGQIATDLMSIYNSQNNANAANARADQWLDRADPFRAERPGYFGDLRTSVNAQNNAGANLGESFDMSRGYGPRLDDTMSATAAFANQANRSLNDPNFWTDQSWLSGIGDYAANATQRRLASQGYNYSGNTQQEVARTLRDTMAPYVIQGQQNMLDMVDRGNQAVSNLGNIVSQRQANAVGALNAGTGAVNSRGDLAGAQFNPAQAGPTLAALTGQATNANTSNSANWGALTRDALSLVNQWNTSNPDNTITRENWDDGSWADSWENS